MGIQELLAVISFKKDCEVLPSKGQPTIRQTLFLPEDVRTFYELCGGVALYSQADYPVTIVSPDNFSEANPVILGHSVAGDITSSWYIVAADDNGDFLSIDLAPERLGRCYDSFHEVHGVAGSCAIIALSFTDLLHRLVQKKGQRWYWLEPDFQSIGDAYN